MTPPADKLSAVIGAIRFAVDAGYAFNYLLVVQIGKIATPQLPNSPSPPSSPRLPSTGPA